MALADIPGLGAYYQRRQMNEQAPLAELQQVGAVQGLLAKMQAQAKQQKYEEAIASLGPNATPDQVASVVQQIDPIKAMELRQKAEKPDNRPEILRLQDAAAKLPPESPMRAQIDARIKSLAGPADKPEALSSIGKLIKERDALPLDSPTRKIYDRAISDFKPGGVTINNNPNAMPSLGKPAMGVVDQGLLDTTKGIMTLNTIEGQYKPEFQQLAPRAGAMWSSWKEKAGVGLDPADQKFLSDFSSYKRNAINTMNEYIKSITGAAMSEPEAKRILAGMPRVGDGLLDGDSPTEFKAKLDDATKQTKLALARYEYIKRNGIALLDAKGEAVVPLDRMPQIMNERGKTLEVQFKQANSRITPQELATQVRGVLAKEFGLVR